MRTALITAGGTAEPIDDVRVLTNLSTGRLGASLARALCAEGVRVTLIASHTLIAHPEWLDPRVQLVPFRTFAELDAALQAHTSEPPDLLLMVAAVSDYSPLAVQGKLPSQAETMEIRLRRNPKLLAGLRARCGVSTRLVGFKLMSGVSQQQLLDTARAQARSCGLDFTVANDLAQLSGGQHPLWLVPAEGDPLQLCGDKDQVAVGLVAQLLPPDPSPVLGPAPRISQVTGDPAHRVRSWVLEAPSLPGYFTPDSLAEAQQVAAASLRGQLEGTWGGGPFAVRAVGGAVVLGPIEAAWQTHREWGAAALDTLELPSDQLRPILDGPEIIGVRALVAAQCCGLEGLPLVAVICADHEALDRVSAALEAGPLRVVVAAEDEAFWVQRGFQALVRWRQALVMLPPSLRDDRLPAASLALVHPGSRQVLIGRRCPQQAEAAWAFPGGRVAPGESALGAALRRLGEETGLDAVPVPLARHSLNLWDGACVWALECFVLASPLATPPVQTPGLAARWVPLEEAIRLSPMAPGMRRVLRALHRQW